MNALKLDAPDPIQAAALYVYFWASPCRQVIMLLVQRYMRLYAEAVWYNSNESVRNFWDLSHGRALRDPYFSRRPHRLAPATPAPRAPWGSGGIRAAGADSAPNHRAAPTRRGRTPGLPPRRVWHFIAGSPSGAGDAELAGADGAACPDRCTSSFDCRWRGCLRRAGLVHLAVTQS